MSLNLKRKILAIGGSKAITIPPNWLNRHGLTIGGEVELTVSDFAVIVRPVEPRRAAK